MKQVTLLASRTERLQFLDTLQKHYSLDQSQIEMAKNIQVPGIAYIFIPLSEERTLRLEILSDNPSRFGSEKFLSSVMRKAGAFITVGKIPDLFVPHLNDEMIIFKSQEHKLIELMDLIASTPTFDQAKADNANNVKANSSSAASAATPTTESDNTTPALRPTTPQATPATLARLRGLFSTNLTNKTSQDWRNDTAPDKKASGSTSTLPYSDL